MTRTMLQRLVVALTLAAIANGPAMSQSVTGEGAPGMAAPFGAVTDQAVLDFLAQNNLPGATVAVTRRGRLVWSKGYGFANEQTGTQMQPWHRSRIGSVSKILTAIGALKMAESESSSLDLLNQPIYGIPGPFVSLNSPWPGDDALFAVLSNPNDYWGAMFQGVQALNDTNFVNSEMNKTIDWASQITITHLLSHTSGLLGSGDVAAAAAHFNKDEDALTYKEVHLAVLMALRKDNAGNPIPPFSTPPGTQSDYSNHGPGLVGHIIDELAGPGISYRQYIEQNVLHPLGLFDVVPTTRRSATSTRFPTARSSIPVTPVPWGWPAAVGRLRQRTLFASCARSTRAATT